MTLEPDIILATVDTLDGSLQRYEVPINLTLDMINNGFGVVIEVGTKKAGNVPMAHPFYPWFNEVQLELGDKVTAFEVRPIAEELALCQRYYENSFAGLPVSDNANNGRAGVSMANTRSSTSISGGPIFFKTPKRTLPTVTIYAPGNAIPLTVAGQASILQGLTWSTIPSASLVLGLDSNAFIPVLNVANSLAVGTCSEIWLHFEVDAEL
jgi:hypothetical protein